MLTQRDGIVACWQYEVPVGSYVHVHMMRTQLEGEWRMVVSPSLKFIQKTLYEQADDGSLNPWTGAQYVFPRPDEGLQVDVDSEPIAAFVTGFDESETCIAFNDMTQYRRESTTILVSEPDSFVSDIVRFQIEFSRAKMIQSVIQANFYY